MIIYIVFALFTYKISTTPGTFERVLQSLIRRCELCNTILGRHFEHLLWVFFYANKCVCTTSISLILLSFTVCNSILPSHHTHFCYSECNPIIGSTVNVFRLDQYNHPSYFVNTVLQYKCLMSFSSTYNSTYIAFSKLLYIPVYYNFMHNILINVISALNKSISSIIITPYVPIM